MLRLLFGANDGGCHSFNSTISNKFNWIKVGSSSMNSNAFPIINWNTIRIHLRHQRDFAVAQQMYSRKHFPNKSLHCSIVPSAAVSHLSHHLHLFVLQYSVPFINIPHIHKDKHTHTQAYVCLPFYIHIHIHINIHMCISV